MTVYQAHTAAEANGYLASCKGGDTIELDGVTNWRPLSAAFTNPVTLKATGAGVIGFYGRTLDGFIVTGGPWKPGPSTGNFWAFRAKCLNVLFDQAEITANDSTTGTGLLFDTGCTNVEIKRSLIHDLSIGIQGVGMTNTHVHDNDIFHIGQDGMNFKDVHGLTIEDNKVRDPISRIASHPDAIQIETGTITAPIKSPNTDIIIRRNYLRSGGQGIYIANSAKLALAYQRVAINDNDIIAGTANGLLASAVDVLAVTDNRVFTNDVYEDHALLTIGASCTNVTQSGNTVNALGVAFPLPSLPVTTPVIVPPIVVPPVIALPRSRLRMAPQFCPGIYP